MNFMLNLAYEKSTLRAAHTLHSTSGEGAKEIGGNNVEK
jgi:hypothetical protein